MKHLKITLLALLVIVTSAYAATKWTIDKAHTKIQFTAEHMKISEVTGEFKEYEGSIKSEGDDFENATINVNIMVNSINTDNEKRDKHLKGEDFFHAEKYPKITFKSTSLEKMEGDKYKMSGKLTMRGNTQEEEFTAVHNGTVKDPWGKTKSGWKVTGTINRFDYGLEWNKTLEAGGLVVGEEIDITADVELAKK